MDPQPANLILQIQQKLQEHYGPLHWWPADHPFEVVVGAILTQNTAWTNVERAIDNLKHADAMIPEMLAGMPIQQLEQLIRPAGFFRQKAHRLKFLAKHLVEEWQSDLAAFCGGPLDEARQRLLTLTGIGPETADSILLYAGGRPSFVVDAYTMRIFTRLGLLHGTEKYAEVRQLFMLNVPADAQVYNEYHAQIVSLAKNICRKKQPLCEDCPLKTLCHYAHQTAASVRQGSPVA